MGLTENIIKSLEKEEIYFLEKEILSDKNSQAKRLFGLIVEFGDDEEKIAIRFKKIAPKGNISVVRNQLSQILLSGIEQYHHAQYTVAEVNSLLLQIKIFIEKSAFDVVKKLLDKAWLIAEESELFPQLTELLEIKLHLYQTKNLHDDDAKALTLLQIKAVMQKMQNHSSYRLLLFEQMDLINQSYMIRTVEIKEKFEKIMHHELLESPQKALSIKAAIEYWTIKSQFFSVTNQHELALQGFQEVVKLLQQHIAIKRQRNMDFLWANSQLAHIGYFLQQPSIMRRALDAIRDAEKYNDIEQIAAFTFYTNYSMAYYDLIKDSDGLKRTVDEAKAGLKIYIQKIKHDARIALIVACVSSYVEFGEYDNALEMIREFSDYLFTENRMDAKVILLFYELIAQIETGNELMVNDTLQNFNRYLLRNDLKSEFEQLMIRFLKIISSFSLKAKKELEVLREQLIQLPQKSILDQHRVLYQVLSTMIDSKLAGKKFHEYLKEMK